MTNRLRCNKAPVHAGASTSVQRLVHFVIQSLLWGYVGGVLAWSVAQPLVGDRSFFVAILSYLGVWLFAPLLILMPWTLLTGRRRSTALLLIPGALFLWFYGALFLPSLARGPLANESVTILTFNVRYLNTDTDALAATLIDSGADILALQEVTYFHRQHLAPILAERYPYTNWYLPAGLALYSRYPISSQRILEMQPWPAQSVVIQVGEQSLHLDNVHLARAGILDFVLTLDSTHIREASEARQHQITQILDAIGQTDLPAVVACDCNMTDLTSAYAQVTATMRDAHRERGWGLGHTLLVPRGLEIPSSMNVAVQRIDYLFYSPELRVTEAQTMRGDSGSDHRPIWARFVLPP